jgi:hypothetical protein
MKVKAFVDKFHVPADLLEQGIVGISVATPAPGVAEFHAHVLICRIEVPTVATAVLELYHDILVHEE